MHKLYVLLFTLLFIFTNTDTIWAAQPTQPDLSNSVVSGSKQIVTSSGTRTVQYVVVNLNDTQLEVRPVLAHDEIGKTESLESMAQRSSALAAINGTFFVAYTTDEYKRPWGKIVIDYIERNEGISGSSIGFNGNAFPVIDQSLKLSSDGYQHITSAGPTLIKNGQIVLDPASENMHDPKLTTASGQRSFIGYTAENRLIMGTVPNVTLAQLAVICQEMGLVAAMNLDGGASSGLYAHGQYLTRPGRDLSNALVVVPRTKQPINVEVNGAPITFSTDPIVVGDTVYVPMREIFEHLGASVSWDNQKKIVEINKDDLQIRLDELGYAYINQDFFHLSERPKNIAGKMMVPLPFVSLALGVTTEWESQSRTVVITSAETR